MGLSRCLTVPEAEMLAGKCWHEYFAFLLPDLKIEQCIHLQKECILHAQKHPEIISKHIRITPHALEVLEAISKSSQLFVFY